MGVVLWDAETGENRAELGCDGCAFLKFSPDDRILAAEVRYFGISLLDLRTGKEQSRIPDIDSYLGNSTRAFSPDGGFLAAMDLSPTGLSSVLKLWDTSTGAELAQYELGGFAQGTVAYSRDGTLLAVDYWSYNHYRDAVAPRIGAKWAEWLFPYLVVTALLDVGTGREMFHVPACYSPVFLPGGRTLATIGTDRRSILLWDIPPKRAVHPVVAWISVALAIGLSAAWWFIRRRGKCCLATLEIPHA